MGERAPEYFIFVSHVHEEAPVATVLQRWLQAMFPGHVAVFVSSEYESNPLGNRWLEVIDGAMNRARLVITLLSRRSYGRKWIHLEAGWALGRNIDILPICHSGLTIDDLPRPYSDYTGVNVEARDFAGRLIHGIRERLRLAATAIPEGMQRGFEEEMRAACASCVEQAESLAQAAAPAAPAQAPTELPVDDKQLAVLRFLAQLHGRHDVRIGDTDIARHLGISVAKATLLMNRLVNTELVDTSLILGAGTFYSISDDGLEFLDVRGLLE